MIWTSRKNPEVHGEGLPVEDKEEALAICRHHNWLYPQHVHKAIDEETNENQQQ